MARRIALTDSKSRRVAVKAASTRRVSAADLGKRLGAEVVAAEPLRSGSPPNFAAVREEVFRRLRSTGGRPGLEGVGRKKIPLTEGDWKIVKQVANHISEPGFRPSAGQVASVLLSITLRSLNPSLEAIVKRDLKSVVRAESHS